MKALLSSISPKQKGKDAASVAAQPQGNAPVDGTHVRQGKAPKDEPKGKGAAPGPQGENSAQEPQGNAPVDGMHGPHGTSPKDKQKGTPGGTPERHPFEPFLPEGARMLFLGSFPPQPHRWCMPFYYPNWINDFWRILGIIHFGDKDHFCIPGQKRFDEAAIRQFCTARGLAFYDTACEVKRLKDNASDAFLEVVTPTDIPALLRRIPLCHTIVTTGQKATEIVAETFNCAVPKPGCWTDIALPGVPERSIRFWRMPSTSRAYPLPLQKKADEYRRLFKPKKLILWDLDGTLIDTLEDLGAAVNHALELRGLPLHSMQEYRKMVGHGVRNLVTQALPSALQADDAFIDSALKDFKAFYQSHIDVHTQPYKGMGELLAELQAKGVKMAVASNKFQEGTEHLIKEFFPDIQFVAILGNRPGYPLKPEPEIVQEVLEKAGIGPEDAIMVGDSPTDMRTAANGGIDALAVGWGYRTAVELAGNRIVHTVEQLRGFLSE